MNRIATAVVATTFLAFASASFAAAPADTSAPAQPAANAKMRGGKAAADDPAQAQFNAARKDAEKKMQAAWADCKTKKGAEARTCYADSKAEHDRAVADAKAQRDKSRAAAKTKS